MSTATIEQPTTTTTTETPCVRFKKRQATGDWVLRGPEAMVVEGPVTVTKMNGKTSIENVLSVGASFDVDGVPYRYGYLKTKEESREPKPAATASAAPKSSEADFVPDDFEPAGDVEDPAAWDF